MRIYDGLQYDLLKAYEASKLKKSKHRKMKRPELNKLKVLPKLTKQ
jgi:hypothetical protein